MGSVSEITNRLHSIGQFWASGCYLDTQDTSLRNVPAHWNELCDRLAMPAFCAGEWSGRDRKGVAAPVEKSPNPVEKEGNSPESITFSENQRSGLPLSWFDKVYQKVWNCVCVCICLSVWSQSYQVLQTGKNIGWTLGIALILRFVSVQE